MSNPNFFTYYRASTCCLFLSTNMEFCLRQTPRFTLPSPVTQKEAPRARHHELVANIQWESAAPKHSKPERAPGHSHHRHHLRSPFHHDGPHHHHRSAPDEQRQVQLCLPFIPPEDVAKANGEDNSPLCASLSLPDSLPSANPFAGIVIDDIVYDVTEFAKRHPGGQMPLRNLAGQSCSCKVPLSSLLWLS